MLKTFRTLAGGTAAKILLVLLILSFVVWGVEDMIRHPGGAQTVASVGKEKITRMQFANALRRETEMMQRMLGNNATPEIIKSFNLPQKTLRRLVNDALIRQETESLGLIPSDDDVVRRIRTMPSFQDSSGNFDKAIFDATLRHSGLSEKKYVASIRDEIAANLLIDTLMTAIPISDTAIIAMLEAREEQRSVTLYMLSPSLVNNMPKPTEENLKEYYTAHSQEFVAPELRTVSYVTLSAANIEAGNVREEDLHVAYRERADEFKRPERRVVERLIYTTEDAAKNASEMLKSGKNIAQVAKETEVLNKDAVSMGNIERKDVFAEAAPKVFALKAGENTPPIQSPFGWQIFHVVSIEESAPIKFGDVRASLEKELKQRRADDALMDINNKIQDAIAGGSTLEEVAKENNLKVTTMGPFNRKGEADGAKLKGLPEDPLFLDSVFKTEERADGQVASKDGVYYFFRTDKVVPERVRPMDEVRADVVSGWEREERSKRLSVLAQDVAKSFTQGNRSEAVTKYNLSASDTTNIRRNDPKIAGMSVPPQLIDDIFARKVQENTQAYPLHNGNFAIAIVNNIAPVKIAANDPKYKTQLAEMRKGLDSSMQNEILDQYSRYLMEKYSVSINEAALQSVIQ